MDSVEVRICFCYIYIWIDCVSIQDALFEYDIFSFKSVIFTAFRESLNVQIHVIGFNRVMKDVLS